MTAVIVDAETAPAVEETPADVLARWSDRAGAFAVDVLPGLAVVIVMALVALTVPLDSVWWWVCVVVGGLVILLTAANRCLLPTITGWSLGRAVFGVAVGRVGGAPAAPVGPWRLLIRDLAHLFDTASLAVGWLWPLWDQRRRTFADLLLRTEVRQAELARPPRNAPVLAALAALLGALLCIAGAASSYLVVYQRDRAIGQARTEIAGQGPRIIEEMLSYQPASLAEDFARAQALVTDRYREKLAAEQEAVRKGKPVANQYVVVNRAVRSTTPRSATMLLFLQGRRGQSDGGRLISATVRVNFEKSAAQWRVDDLTVVTKPLAAEDGK